MLRLLIRGCTGLAVCITWEGRGLKGGKASRVPCAVGSSPLRVQMQERLVGAARCTMWCPLSLSLPWTSAMSVLLSDLASLRCMGRRWSWCPSIPPTRRWQLLLLLMFLLLGLRLVPCAMCMMVESAGMQELK